MFALAAIAGMLTMAPEASASTSSGKLVSPKSCCAVPTPSACCCCPAEAVKATSPKVAAVETVAVGNLVTAPASSCDCRSDEPTAPASKHESSSIETEQRPVRSSADLSEMSFDVRPASTFARFILPNGSPPRSPLYLLTSHLLI